MTMTSRIKLISIQKRIHHKIPVPHYKSTYRTGLLSTEFQYIYHIRHKFVVETDLGVEICISPHHTVKSIFVSYYAYRKVDPFLNCCNNWVESKSDVCQRRAGSWRHIWPPAYETVTLRRYICVCMYNCTCCDVCVYVCVWVCAPNGRYVRLLLIFHINFISRSWSLESICCEACLVRWFVRFH